MITTEQYNDALKICKDYLDQQSKVVNSIREKILDVQRAKDHKQWYNVKKGDFIKIVNAGGNVNCKLLSGDIVQVAKVYKYLSTISSEKQHIELTLLKNGFTNRYRIKGEAKLVDGELRWVYSKWTFVIHQKEVIQNPST